MSCAASRSRSASILKSGRGVPLRRRRGWSACFRWPSGRNSSSVIADRRRSRRGWSRRRQPDPIALQGVLFPDRQDENRGSAVRERPPAVRRCRRRVPMNVPRRLPARRRSTGSTRGCCSRLAGAPTRCGRLCRRSRSAARTSCGLSNALSALYPRGSDEKRLLDAMLWRCPGRRPGPYRTRGELPWTQVWLKNFRCFREEQTARLAPLTLLVGENSTGKTSFMALDPRSCGTCSSYAPLPASRKLPTISAASTKSSTTVGEAPSAGKNVEVGFVFGADDTPYRFDAVIVRQGSLSEGPCDVEAGPWRRLGRGAPGGYLDEVHSLRDDQRRVALEPASEGRLLPLGPAWGARSCRCSKGVFPRAGLRPASCRERGSASISQEDCELVSRDSSRDSGLDDVPLMVPRPFASAPVRSRPRRTYDPAPRPFGIPRVRTYPCIFPRCSSRTRSRGNC